MCNCIQELEERVKLKLMEDNSIVEEQIEWSGFQNGAILFYPDATRVLTNIYEISYRQTKTDGTPYKSKSTVKINLSPTYCCHCGKKIVEDKTE